MWEYRQPDELYHYGILGMKWGVRRFQNKDGSLTKDGKSRYGGDGKNSKEKSDGSTKSETSNKQNIVDVKKATQLSKTLLSDEEATPQSSRATAAAVTGLECVIKTKHGDVTYPYNPHDPEDQRHFLLSDQLVGYAQIADLANQGYSSSKIKSIIKDAYEIDRQTFQLYGIDEKAYGRLPFDKSGISAISECGGNYGKEMYDYIDACVDYNKVKHSSIQPWSYNSPDELYHYGILGMKWGIRRYQNKDGSLTVLGRARYGTVENLNKVVAAKKKAADYKKNKKAYEKQAKKNARADEEVKRIKREAGMKVKGDTKKETSSTSRTESSQKPQKKISEMSNKEIQEKINRIQLEKQLKREMASLQVEKISTGKKIVNKLLSARKNPAVQTALINPVAKYIGDSITIELNKSRTPSKSELLEKQKKDTANEMLITQNRVKTVENKKKLAEYKSNPAYADIFKSMDKETNSGLKTESDKKKKKK